MKPNRALLPLPLSLLPSLSFAQSSSSPTDCSSSLTASYAAPSVASGFAARLVAQDLDRPRSIRFDSAGNLLVVEQGRGGVTGLRLRDSGEGAACVEVDERVDVTEDGDLNHGLELSPDGTTLYASSPSEVLSWPYDADSLSTTSDDPRTLVANMASGGHSTRTLLLSRQVPGLLLVSRGSDGNIDEDTRSISSGRSQIRVFDLNATAEADEPYDYTDGAVLGWGLRNSVGVGEYPGDQGGVWSVENSVDELERADEDIHQDNPGEELNFHGPLNASADAASDRFGANFGYPDCFAAWEVEDIPENGELRVGTQFAIGDLDEDDDDDDGVDDEVCAEDRTAPRLTFAAHTAPLDIVFDEAGETAWITFHGSWNRDDPDGYRLSAVRFSPDTAQPLADPTSTEAAIPIMSNPDLSACPDGCFRPVGLAFDARGRLFMSSDATGEIYVVVRTDEDEGSVEEGGVPTGLGPSETTGDAAAPSETGDEGDEEDEGAAAAVMVMGSGRSGVVWAVVGLGALVGGWLVL
ncbi:hypothetical protein BDY21DRAFT_292223 [Lineolata rhizophorae]|uniref:Pyrroloquinoline quinone-dependent pyranose dehydrogenase beta-propeller domain-containing protein n=1 Tax=Lineolata rhizophorae TaxID=578093 RepID=A0A6A6NRC6_9PEZI|nr:hypothetical protein BDY21DRAFT_292223 [Lineolata rhizophorae]